MGEEELEDLRRQKFAQMQKSEELAKAEYAWALCMVGDERGFPPLLEAIGLRIVKGKRRQLHHSQRVLFLMSGQSFESLSPVGVRISQETPAAILGQPAKELVAPALLLPALLLSLCRRQP